MAYISYLRVSTEKQGKKRKYAPQGLGVEAQRELILQRMLEAPLMEFVEVESGRKNSRPILQQALAECKASGAILVVAKLDRLARDTSFIMSLHSSKVDFIACDVPFMADPHMAKLMIFLLAWFAEYEAGRIGQRTKDALAVLKAAGVKLGNPDTSYARECALKARQMGQKYNLAIQQTACRLYQEERSYTKVAYHLNYMGVTTERGGKWTAEQVKRLLSIGSTPWQLP